MCSPVSDTRVLIILITLPVGSIYPHFTSTGPPFGGEKTEVEFHPQDGAIGTWLRQDSNPGSLAVEPVQ